MRRHALARRLDLVSHSPDNDETTHLMSQYLHAHMVGQLGWHNQGLAADAPQFVVEPPPPCQAVNMQPDTRSPLPGHLARCGAVGIVAAAASAMWPALAIGLDHQRAVVGYLAQFVAAATLTLLLCGSVLRQYRRALSRYAATLPIHKPLLPRFTATALNHGQWLLGVAVAVDLLGTFGYAAGVGVTHSSRAALVAGIGIAAGGAVWIGLANRTVRYTTRAEHERTAAHRANLARDHERALRQAGDSRAATLASVLATQGLSALTPLPPGPTLLEVDEIAHLSLRAYYYRLDRGEWVDGQHCDFLVTTERLVARTSTHGELSHWWDRLTAFNVIDNGVELHYDSSDPVAILGPDTASVRTYVLHLHHMAIQ